MYNQKKAYLQDLEKYSKNIETVIFLHDYMFFKIFFNITFKGGTKVLIILKSKEYFFEILEKGSNLLYYREFKYFIDSIIDHTERIKFLHNIYLKMKEKEEKYVLSQKEIRNFSKS